jgi:hypothetical protein
MARTVFFSFHYQRDIWRVNQIRNSNVVVGAAAAGFRDGSLWEEAKKKGDSAIKKIIDDGLVGTSVTVVLIGSETSTRKYVNYEIEKSIERKNGILGLRIHNIRDQNQRTDWPGKTPQMLIDGGHAIYTWTNSTDFGRWVEEAYQDAKKQQEKSLFYKVMFGS